MAFLKSSKPNENLEKCTYISTLRGQNSLCVRSRAAVICVSAPLKMSVIVIDEASSDKHEQRRPRPNNPKNGDIIREYVVIVTYVFQFFFSEQNLIL